MTVSGLEGAEGNVGCVVFRKVDKTFWCSGRETEATPPCKLYAKNKYGTGMLISYHSALLSFPKIKQGSCPPTACLRKSDLVCLYFS